ncbi:primary-amine oxidase [Actinoplanes sp. NPDC026619]|uniref:primary-amine oxidase n=1 Tax=Actinoplanes sp. NPDC026619 TaxID=3155798 RepID=UPI0033FE7504
MSSHPLARLTAAEIDRTREVLAEAGVLAESTRFAYVGLAEPDKKLVLAGTVAPRQVRVLLLDRATGLGRDCLVDLTAGAIAAITEADATLGGQMPILDEEFMVIEEILAESPEWLAALAKRGLPVEEVRACPLSAGNFDYEDEAGKRMIRVLAFHQPDPAALVWAYPIDGLVAYVNLTERTAHAVYDHQVHPIPQEKAEWEVPARNTLKAIEITQPDGPSFAVDDDVVTWEKWQFRIGFDMREGLILNQISFDGRPIVYRASIAEMVVPYADPSPARFWQNYFDTGEYLFARYTNSLELGCDCLGEIHYFDATLADEQGAPRNIGNAICMHEEDYGVLWKHTDLFNEMAETRRQRRLVISFFVTIGNYDYGFYWYLYLDGTIQLECKATGVVFTSAYPGADYPYATEIAPGLGAPFHQHLFSARLDMTVDGAVNSVDEVDAVRVPVGPDNPYGNAFGRRTTRLKTELEAQRLADPAAGRVWHIVNPEVTNRLGRPVGYALHPAGLPTLLADESSSIHSRATFATKHLWVTQYSPDERYPAGDLVNQSPAGAGLPAWTAADRPIDGADIVIWHTFGLTHFPRPEDWPIMPVDYAGFTLKPYGFFDRNPALDVPKSAARHCH